MSFAHISESIPELLRQSTRLVRIGQESERARPTLANWRALRRLCMAALPAKAKLLQ